MKLLAWLMPARSPAGVVTRSTSGCQAFQLAFEYNHGEDGGAGGNVAGAHAYGVGGHHTGASIASGGANVIPGCSVPVGSSSLAPSSVSVPAGVPATSGSGSRSASFHGWAATSGIALNFSMNSVS